MRTRCEHEVCSPLDESMREESEPITPTREERLALGLDEKRRLRDFLHAESAVHGVTCTCSASLLRRARR
jgi:hypothetical protein